MITFKKASQRESLFIRLTGLKIADFLHLVELIKSDWEKFEASKKCHGRNYKIKTLEDKKVVSGILWKRMDNGMRLQVDATILYAQAKEGMKIYIKDTQINSPYNTYRVDGLPLGPISNPGIDSIIAAIYPTKTNYYYYLSAPDGKTIFSKTLEEHNYNKNKYLK